MATDIGQRNTILLIGAAVIALVVVDRAFNGETPPPAPKPAPTHAVTVPVGPSPDLLKIRAQREVKAILRDPDSAVFTDMVAHSAPALVVCGLVNSRNGFGGMTGNQRFISGAVTAVEDQMAAGEMDNLWAKAC